MPRQVREFPADPGRLATKLILGLRVAVTVQLGLADIEAAYREPAPEPRLTAAMRLTRVAAMEAPIRTLPSTLVRVVSKV